MARAAAGITLYQGSAGSLSIDSASAPALGGAFNFIGTTGVSTTGGGDIGLQSGGALALDQAVDAEVPGTVRLVSNGDVTQGASITAGSLGVVNTSTTDGGIVLGSANQISNLAAMNNAPGGVVSRSIAPLI